MADSQESEGAFSGITVNKFWSQAGAEIRLLLSRLRLYAGGGYRMLDKKFRESPF
jgi:hypothetical protein